MSKPAPLFVDEKNAAHLLGLKPDEFRGLVQDGVLPKALNLGRYPRWDVEQLHTIARGHAARPSQDFEL
ncbi:hypothetical protein GLP59_06615 [Sulfitobacter sp. M220]|uniref:helix-turn-helix transcriptional regulator n=1 Tax=unclassified Sulfitobacter TaxID=196795 RepID=UPI0004E3FEEA|nr:MULTISPECIES: hypothetical protein [unclassified Sulfitobacter]MCF7777326.1 hypothetical protein [Sulfitobacter sp. M220]PTA98973.1 hypothetical protein C8254_10965 [Sulfitobacter sp. CB-A]ULO18905.1 hypothetical protein IV89_001887 [Sulfitobacter sp. CB2047]